MRRERSRREVLTWSGLLAIGSAGCIGVESGEDPEVDVDRPNRSEPGPSDDRPDPPEDDPEPLAIDIDDFEDLSTWDVIDGTVVEDTEFVLTGTQSARIDVGEEHVRAAIARQLEVPQDLESLRPHLAVRSEEMIYPRIRAFDRSGDYLEFRAGVRPDLDIQHFDFGISDVDGSPDLAAIEEVQFNVHVGSDAQARMWLDDLRISPGETPGVVMIHFDDALETDYTEALPILRRHDMVASTFINPGYLGREVGGSPRLSVDQLDALDDAGWDICSHSMRHADLSTADAATLESEVGDAYRWLREHGFAEGARYFVYPYSAYDQSALDVVGEYHDFAFAAGWPAAGRAANRLLIPRAVGDPDFDQARSAIDATVQFGGTTAIFYHELAGDQLRAFERTIEYLDAQRNEGSVAVQSVTDLEDDLTLPQ